MFAENKPDRSYKAHRAGGGVIGFIRGLTASVLGLSMLGGGLYVAAGAGVDPIKLYSFDDEKFDLNYAKRKHKAAKRTCRIRVFRARHFGAFA